MISPDYMSNVNRVYSAPVRCRRDSYWPVIISDVTNTPYIDV